MFSTEHAYSECHLLPLSVNGNNNADSGSAYLPGLMCGPDGMWEPLVISVIPFEYLEMGLLARLFVPAWGSRHGWGMTLPTQAQNILLGVWSRITEKASGAVRGTRCTLWVGPVLR